jgi:hypothetical protein
MEWGTPAIREDTLRQNTVSVQIREFVADKYDPRTTGPLPVMHGEGEEGLL